MTAAMRAKFTWVPEGFSDDQVLKWMSAFPKPKQPLVGTAGEILRVQMLERQLPRHDSEILACQGAGRCLRLFLE